MKYFLLILCGLAALTDAFGSAGGEGGPARLYGWETQRTEPADKVDLALIYGGSAHRSVVWGAGHFAPYVSYTDLSGDEHWLFDGFLFLEFIDGHGKIFATGYNGRPATRGEWESLLDYYFTPGISLSALDQAVADAAARLGTPPVKPRVVMVIPEPIVCGPGSHYGDEPADYWGPVDGKTLDFTCDADRIVACRWYIDSVRERFDRAGFRNVELAGFYWLAEEAEHTATILAGVGDYLAALGYSFDWIPYWKHNDDPDYLHWKSYGFSNTYLQPNYFFNDNTPYSRLDEACRVAREYDMDLELEFDSDVFTKGKNRGQRLYEYMNAFRENGVLETKRIAYYMDTDTLYELSRSTDEADLAIYHDFNSFVLEHKRLYRSRQSQ